jgi:hypothetical protein
VYFWIFLQLHRSSWWLGAIIGLLHGAVLVTLVFAWLPLVHPRMASDYDGPVGQRRLEPPGAFGLNYGRRTPLMVVLAQALYGLILGLVFPLL